MGLLSKMVTRQKIPCDMTGIKLVAQDDGRETFIRLLDPQYSTNGEIVETVELPSFDGEYAVAYATVYSMYLHLALDIDNLLRAGELFQ